MLVYKRYEDVIIRDDKSGELEAMYVCWDDGEN